MKRITFIHAADLHLDSPMTGLTHLPKPIFERIKDSTFAALKTLTEAAIKHQVDFVIIAGDLFDEEDRSVRAQTRLRKEMIRLYEHNIPVYIIHGNHDHLNGTWIHLDMPANVHIFSEKVEMKVFAKPNVITHLYGFSYPTRHVEEGRLAEYEKQEGADFHIGILHGHGEGASDHSRYAPFSVKELMEKKFDYWALGHIHKRAVLHEQPYVVYPGNIQGRNKKEIGQKGCYLVTMTEIDTRLDFLETADIQWDRIHINAQEALNFNELYLLCLKEMGTKRLSGKGMLLSLSLNHVNLSEKELSAVKNGELLQALQEEEGEEAAFVWPVEIAVEQTLLWDRSQLESESDFYRELFQTADELDNIAESTRSLYGHPVAGKFLSTLSEKEKQELQQEALQTLVGLLHEE